MAILTLKDAVEYIRTSKASELLLKALKSVGQIFTFEEERSNRVNRYVAVIEAYKRGTPIEDIMKKYGCSKRTIYDYVIKADVARRSFTPAETKAKIIADYKAKIPVVKIAELNAVSLRYVQQLAKEANLSRYKKRK